MKKFLVVVGLILLLAACGNNDTEKGETKDIHGSTPRVYAKFRDIDIVVDEAQAIIFGEASTSNNEFFYKIEQGEKVIVEERKLQVDREWGAFEITLDVTDEMKEAVDVPMIALYTKDKTGDTVNPNYVPIDLEMGR